MAKVVHETVDLFIEHAPVESQDILNELRKLFLEVIPGVEEKISYGVPYYKFCGEIGGYSVAKAHVTLGYGAGVLTDNDKELLENLGYKVNKGTFQIKFTQTVPKDIVRNILKKRAEINENEWTLLGKK